MPLHGGTKNRSDRTQISPLYSVVCGYWNKDRVNAILSEKKVACSAEIVDSRFHLLRTHVDVEEGKEMHKFTNLYARSRRKKIRNHKINARASSVYDFLSLHSCQNLKTID